MFLVLANAWVDGTILPRIARIFTNACWGYCLLLAWESGFFDEKRFLCPVFGSVYVLLLVPAVFSLWV
jgi:hypothetical protein